MKTETAPQVLVVAGPTATGKTDGRHDPESGGCSETADHVFLFAEDDGSGTDETDTADDLCSDTRDIPS